MLTYNHMVALRRTNDAALNQLFRALADGTRRDILARSLAGQFDPSSYAPEIATWLQRGLAPQAEDRFADAAEMQEQWRTAAGAVLERERRVPWWKRIFGGEEGVESWWREDAAMAE